MMKEENVIQDFGIFCGQVVKQQQRKNSKNNNNDTRNSNIGAIDGRHTRFPIVHPTEHSEETKLLLFCLFM